MINSVITGIFNIIINLVNVILTPIDALIENSLPSLNSAISAIGELFALIGSSIGWGISLIGIPTECIQLIVLYYSFKLTVPIGFYIIKLAIAWYNKLKF